MLYRINKNRPKSSSIKHLETNNNKNKWIDEVDEKIVYTCLSNKKVLQI